VRRSRLVFGLAAVFAGLSVFLAVLGFVSTPLFFVLAIPFGLTTYTLWYHATGRLRERARRGTRWGRRTRRSPDAGDATAGRGGFGTGPREEWTAPLRRSGGRTGRGFGGRVGGRRRTTREGGRRTATARSGPSAAEAYAALGLDPGADDGAVRRAYREKVKQVHPDAEGGSEDAFKRVNEAYERLSGGRRAN
jgi:hypothetical protein